MSDYDGAPRVYRRRIVGDRVADTRTEDVRTAADAGNVGVGSEPTPELARAEEIRHDDTGEVLTRVSREHQLVGQFSLPKHRMKPGWDYEYKTCAVLGLAVTGSEVMRIHSAAWRPEKAANWPELVPPGTAPDAPIEVDGQRLYGRPLRFSREARAEDQAAAEKQLYDRALQSQQGRLAGDEEGLADMGGLVRTVPLGVSIESEAGYVDPRRR